MHDGTFFKNFNFFKNIVTNLNILAKFILRLLSINMNGVSVNKKDDYIRTGIGTTIGIAPLGYIAYDTLKPLSKQDIKLYQQAMLNIMPDIDSFENTKAVAQTILNNEGLTDKGVKIFVSNNTPESTNKLNELFKSEKPKLFIEKAKTMLRNGCNACYHPKSQSVIINDEIAHSSIFHEIGHAKHFNSKNPLMKLLVKSRNITPMGISIVAPIALGVAMFHKVDKTKPQNDKSKTEKTLDFVSNHAGKLTLASYIPIILEEGLASVDGIKMAKKYLKPEQISKLKGNYFKAFQTYAGAGLLVAGAIGLANIIRKGGNNKKPLAQAQTQNPTQIQNQNQV